MQIINHHLRDTGNGKMVVIWTGETLCVNEGSWVLSRISQTSTLPSTLAIKNTAGLDGDQKPAVYLTGLAQDCKIGPLYTEHQYQNKSMF